MNLEDFIATTLQEISFGLEKANTELKTRNKVNEDYYKMPFNKDSYIEFDLSVSIKESTELQKGNKIKANLSIVGLNMGGGLDDSNANKKGSENISRIKFKILPIKSHTGMGYA